MPLVELPTEMAAKIAAWFQHAEVPESDFSSDGLFENPLPSLLPPYRFCHFERWSAVNDGYGNQAHHAPFSYRWKDDADLVSVHEGDIGLPPGYAQAEAIALRSDGIEDHAVACEQARCALRICPNSPSAHIVLALRGCSGRTSATREEAVALFQEAERCAQESIPEATQAKAAASKRAWSEPIMRPLLRSLQGQVNVLMRLGRYGEALGAARRLEALDADPPDARHCTDWGDPWAFMPELLLRVKGPQAAMDYMCRHPLADKLFALPSCELPWLMTSALSYHMLHPDARGAIALLQGACTPNRTTRQACEDGGALAILTLTNTAAVHLVSEMSGSPLPYFLPMDADADAEKASFLPCRLDYATMYTYHSASLWRDIPGAIEWLRTASNTIFLHRHMLKASMSYYTAFKSHENLRFLPAYDKQLVEQAVSIGVQATDSGDYSHSPEGVCVPTIMLLAVTLKREEERMHACRLLLRAGAWDEGVIQEAVRQGGGAGVMEMLLATGKMSPDKLASGDTSPLAYAATLGHFRELEVLLRTCHMGPRASLLNEPRTSWLDDDARDRPLSMVEFAFVKMLKSEALRCSHLGASDGTPCEQCTAGRWGVFSHARAENREKVDFDRCVQLLCDYGLVPRLTTWQTVMLPMLRRLVPSDRRRAARLMELVARAYDVKQRSAGQVGTGDHARAAALYTNALSASSAHEGGAQRIGAELRAAGGGEGGCEGGGGRMQLDAAVRFLLEDSGLGSRLASILRKLPGPSHCCWSCARPSSPSSLTGGLSGGRPSSSTMYLCGACMCATYCSAECQRNDWHCPTQQAENLLAGSVAAAGHQADCVYLQAVLALSSPNAQNVWPLEPRCL